MKPGWRPNFRRSVPIGDQLGTGASAPVAVHGVPTDDAGGLELASFCKNRGRGRSSQPATRTASSDAATANRLTRERTPQTRQSLHLIEQPIEGTCSVGPWPVSATCFIARKGRCGHSGPASPGSSIWSSRRRGLDLVGRSNHAESGRVHTPFTNTSICVVAWRVPHAARLARILLLRPRGSIEWKCLHAKNELEKH